MEKDEIKIGERVDEETYRKIRRAAYIYLEARYGESWIEETTEQRIDDFVAGWQYGIWNPINKEKQWKKNR
jgi:hypothetical protein